MNDELYADTIGGITVTGPIVRIDFLSFSATEVLSNGQPKPVIRQRILMPLEGFQQFFSLMEQAVQRLNTASPNPDASHAGQGCMSLPASIEEGAAYSPSNLQEEQGPHLYSVSGTTFKPNLSPGSSGRIKDNQSRSELETPTPDYPMSPNFS